MIIYHLPFTHQFFVGKLHSPSTSFPVLKIGQKLGPGRRRPACQIPRCQVEMLTGALGLEALKNRELWVRRTREHRAGIFNGCRFVFGCEGTGCPDSDENQEIHLELIGAKNLVLFTCCDVFVLFQYCCFNGYLHRVAGIIRTTMCHLNQE